MSAADVAHTLATRPEEFKRAKVNIALNTLEENLRKQRGLVVHGHARASLPFLVAEVEHAVGMLHAMGVVA